MTAATTHGGEGESMPRRQPSSPRGSSQPLRAGPPANLPRSVAGSHNPWLIAVVVSLATFMEVLDTSIANVALRHIAGSLSVSYDQATWVLTSYLVANAIILPISGWLSGVIGRKNFYLGCVAIFTLSSFACGLAPSLSWLVIARVLQGAGGGGLSPSALSMLRDSFPESKTGMVYALYGVVVVAAPALGPTLGGYLTDTYTWHWVFLINVPIGIGAFILSWLLLAEPEAEVRERHEKWRRGIRVDYWGFALVAVGLGFLQIVLDKGQRDDWFSSPFILWLSVGSALALIALVIRECNVGDPIVDLPLLKNKNFAAALLIRFATFIVLLGTTQLIPQLVQQQLGYTAMQAGLVITPGAFVVIAMMPCVGWAVNKIQPRYLIGAGLLVEAAALYYMSGFTTTMSFWQVAWARCFQVVGIGLLIVPITSVAYIGIPSNKSNHASALINLVRNLGGSVGISFGQTWLIRRAQLHQTRLTSHLTAGDPQYHHTLDEITQQFMQHGHDVTTATKMAMHAIYHVVQVQANMLSYDDIFWIMAVASVAIAPLIFLLYRGTPREAEKSGGR